MYRGIRLVSGAPSSGAWRGRRTVKVLPAPGTLSRDIVPPWRSTRCLVIERPRPVPSYAFCSHPGLVKLIEDSTLLFRRDAYARVADRQLESLLIGLASTHTRPPAGVNFTALLSRLKRISLNRTRSASIQSGKIGVGQVHAFRDRLRLDGPEYFVERLRPIKALEVQLEMSGFDLTEIEDVIDQLE